MYSAYITRIKNLRKHNNADRLQIGECFGNTVVVDLTVENDQLGIYFPTDGQLGQAYAEVNNLIRKKDEEGNNIGGYLDPEKRNIRTMKLRGEDSDGLFMPLESLQTFTNIQTLKEGDTISTLGDILICEKYVPPVKSSQVHNEVEKPSLFPLFKEHTETSQLAFSMGKFRTGDRCIITLKTHGTSGRTSRTLKQEIKQSKFKQLIMKLLKIPNAQNNIWEYATGSRRRVIRIKETLNKNEISFREKWHKFFEGKLQKGETVYYEIVGYEQKNTLIMPQVGNKKVQDKEFTKQYGETTQFTYGCEDGENKILVYRMTLTNEDGFVIEYPWHLVKQRCEQMGIETAPELETFTFTDREDLMERAERLVQGPDPLGKTHIREGIVVRIDNRETFTALKHKNFYFKVLEGLIKEDGIVDTEEQESV